MPTGPRSAAALSIPGLRPTALPPEGGGGLNGSAGLAKLVSPGAAAGDTVCIGGLAGMAGLDVAGVSAAVAGAANIPIADNGACDGDTGACDRTEADGEIPDMPALVFGADNGA